MNVGLPPVSFVDTKTCYRPFVLFSKGDSPQEMQKTLRIRKFPRNIHTEEPITTTYTRRPTPYERPIKDELNKPIKITKSTVTTIEIEKPIGFLENSLVEQALSIVNGEELKKEEFEETPVAGTIDINIKSSENEKN